MARGKTCNFLPLNLGTPRKHGAWSCPHGTLAHQHVMEPRRAAWSPASKVGEMEVRPWEGAQVSPCLQTLQMSTSGAAGRCGVRIGAAEAGLCGVRSGSARGTHLQVSQGTMLGSSPPPMWLLLYGELHRQPLWCPLLTHSHLPHLGISSPES